jgi:hypothetical protein
MVAWEELRGNDSLLLKNAESSDLPCADPTAVSIHVGLLAGMAFFAHFLSGRADCC